MSQPFVFSPSPIAAIPIQNSDQLFPINRIFCVGRNYMAHANEMGVTIDKTKQEPFYFLKNPSCYVPSGQTIPYPSRTENLHYEMELVVAIGKQGKEIHHNNAREYIFGYACGLDLTRRDLQAKAKEMRLPWDIAKNFENAAIISDIIPITQSGEITAGRIELSVNNEVQQSSDLNKMIWSIDEIIEHLSTLYTLEPGDIIMTGTPEGVGSIWPNDELNGSIEGVGHITLTIATK